MSINNLNRFFQSVSKRLFFQSTLTVGKHFYTQNFITRRDLMFLKSITFVCTAFTRANTRGLIGIHNCVGTCKLVCIYYKCKIFKTFKPVAYSLGKIS